jgi:hypothetical protein
MKLFKRKLNQSGFSHIEVGLLLIVVIGISSVGYYVYKNSTSRAGNTYTTLASISADGHTFTEQACITAQSGTSPNYTDIIAALISVNTKTGTITSKSRHHRATSYNPLAYYSVNRAKQITESNWISGTTSSISFDLPPSAATANFTLGVEGTPGSTTKTAGSTQAISTISLCNPPVAAAVAPTVTLVATPTTVTSGSTSTLSWKTTNATKCSASGSWSGSQLTAGTYTTPALTTAPTYTLSCTGAGGTKSSTATVTVSAVTPKVVSTATPTTASGTCATSPPTVSSNSSYPLSQVVSFTGSTLPSQWDDYGNEVQQPAGYVAASHAVFVPGTGLELKGYPDSISGSVGGVTAASGDVSIPVASSGGYDVCFSMSAGSWQNVHLVIISWPVDNNWNEGENDFFEGNPQGMGINVHEIGSSPATNVWQGSWPSALSSGTHVISSRWDPINGYRFYLDGTLVATAPVGGAVTTPTTAHQLSIQMQDTTESSTSSESTTVYWVASYGYN